MDVSWPFGGSTTCGQFAGFRLASHDAGSKIWSGSCHPGAYRRQRLQNIRRRIPLAAEPAYVHSFGN